MLISKFKFKKKKERQQSLNQPFIVNNQLHVPRDAAGQLFLHFKNSQDLKVLGFFAKLYPKISGLVATTDPRVMFIILIITLNLG